MTGLWLLALALQAPAVPDVIVTVEPLEALSLVEGEAATGRVVATVAEGFKIQANPAADRFLVPATLTLEPDDRVLAGAPRYPEGKPHRLQGASSDLAIYEGTVEILVPLTAPAAPSAGEGRGSDAGTGPVVVLQGELKFQACNAVLCLKPASVPVRLPVSIVPEEAARER